MPRPNQSLVVKLTKPVAKPANSKMAKPKVKATINKLNDDCLLMIFQMLNLNERASLRTTCKRFKWLCDQIKIRKLVIFERQPPCTDRRLECTDEKYAWTDVAYVTQLNEFFANRQLIVDQMGKFLKTLVIFGSDQTRAVLVYTFEQLENLELHDVDFESAHLLKSNQIKRFASNSSYFQKPCEVRKYFEALESLKSPELANLSRSALVYGFDRMESTHIVHLIVDGELEFEFFRYCMQRQLFNVLQRLDVVLEDLDVLPYLSEQCPSLKRIDCLIEDLEAFRKRITKSKLQELVNKLRDDLQVCLFGFDLKHTQLNKSSVSPSVYLIDLLNVFNTVVRVNTVRRLCLHLDKLNLKVLKELTALFDMSGFFALVSGLHLNDQAIFVDEEAFFAEHFTNCYEVKFESIQNPVPEPAVFQRFLAHFSASAKEMLMRADGFDVELNNETLDNVAACTRLSRLYVELWDRFDNLNFLFKLTELHTLDIFAYRPVEQSVVAKLIRTLRHLKHLQIVFVKPAGLSKATLKELKQSVNAEHKERFELRGLEFRVELRTKKCGQIVRYLLIEDRLCGSFCGNEEEKMFQLIRFKSNNLPAKQSK